MLATFLGALFFVQGVTAHVAGHGKGMYCRNGLQNEDNPNAYEVVKPLYQLDFNDYWMRGACRNYPPPDGEFLDLPAGGSFTIEVASNRGQTSLSFNGMFTSDWPDGQQHPEDYNKPDCIIEPNLHTQNQSMAAGTAFAIAYKSDIFAVNPEDMVVFSVAEHTPWKRVTGYQVPGAMPPCPPGGCICAWTWVPNGCGQPNMYQNPFKCRVTGATSTTPVGTAQPAVWCEGNENDCVKGPKQLIRWNQRTGNNIELVGYDLSGAPRSPGYNRKLGFSPGAQNDIFVGPPSNTPSTTASSSSLPSTTSSLPDTSPGTSSISEGTPTPSEPPVYTPPPEANNGTTTTAASPSPMCRRRTKLVKKSIIESHLKRHHARRASRRSI